MLVKVSKSSIMSSSSRTRRVSACLWEGRGAREMVLALLRNSSSESCRSESLLLVASGGVSGFSESEVWGAAYFCSFARRARRAFFSRISASVGMEALVLDGRMGPNLEAMSIAFGCVVVVRATASSSRSERAPMSFGVDGVEDLSSERYVAL